MRTKTLAILLTTIVSLSLTPSQAYAADPAPTMTLSETVTVTASPDAAKLNFELFADVDPSVTKPSSQAAKNLAKLSAQARKTLTAMKVTAKDISSTNINIYPQYQFIQETCSSKENSNITNCVAGYQKIISYRASQTFSVMVRDTDSLGDIIDQLIEIDSISLQPIQPVLTQKKKYLNQARKEAVQLIQETAQIYASALSIKLGKVKQLSENSNSQFPPYPIFNLGRAESADSPTKIDLGTTDISVTVTITYALP
ncbi:MAG: SIMPL domain-containing protein [Candidatus Paceibacterota bacterium]